MFCLIFYQKPLFPVTILNFLYRGVWIRQIYKGDSGMIINNSNFSIWKCHSMNDVFPSKTSSLRRCYFIQVRTFFRQHDHEIAVS